MAAELEEKLHENSEIIESSGGVFEVEHNGQLIYSKKATGRFPEEGEVLAILHNLDSGMDLHTAQQVAGENAPHPPSFFEWLQAFVKRKAKHS